MRQHKISYWIGSTGTVYYTIKRRILFFWVGCGGLIDTYEQAEQTLDQLQNAQMNINQARWNKSKQPIKK